MIYFYHICPAKSIFQQAYEVISDADPDFNTDDFTEGYWLLPQELLARIEQGEAAKSDLPKLLKLFYSAD